MFSTRPLSIFLLVQQLRQDFPRFRHATDKERDLETCHHDLVRRQPREKSSHPGSSCLSAPSAIAGMHANQSESDWAPRNLYEEELDTTLTPSIAEILLFENTQNDVCRATQARA